MEYASNGKANAALTTGIIGTAGVGLGLLGNLFGGGWNGWGVTVRTLRACTISLPVKDLVVFASLWLVGELS